MDAALVVAGRLPVPLFTSEELLGRVAEQEGVEVRGTLWLLDRMVTSEALSVRVAACALERILLAGRRLPAT